MNGIFINPGTEPIDDALLENAKVSTGKFYEALAIPALVVLRRPEVDEGGRFGFSLTNPANARVCEIEMPGCDPELMMRGEPWKSPRMYVDGSSWLWQYGLEAARAQLLGLPED